ncbi:MAG TPA: response regulator [Crocinitomix sp.]|nr:response regulator [Crocinitomix sp.]
MAKIAVIEDNAEMRENIKEILVLADYDVVTAEDGKKGVELIKAELPDLILCDIMMPELDGYGVLYMVSKNLKTASIPFIFLTAKSEKEDFRKGMNMGADDYITKPFDDTELLDSIERRLNRLKQFKHEGKFETTEQSLHSFINDAKGLEQLKKLSNEKRVKKYNKKDTIYYEGDIPNFLYFVNTGKVKTYKMNRDGKEFVTNLYKKGDFLGYKSLIADEAYEETAAALENVELTLIPKDDFLHLLYSSKEVSTKFIKMLAGSIDVKQQELLNLAYDTVRKRVADSLLKLEAKYKQENQDHFNIAISRDDLASIVGTATESVIRTLSEFKHDGYISVKGSNITILQPEKLKNFRF